MTTNKPTGNDINANNDTKTGNDINAVNNISTGNDAKTDSSAAQEQANAERPSKEPTTEHPSGGVDTTDNISSDKNDPGADNLGTDNSSTDNFDTGKTKDTDKIEFKKDPNDHLGEPLKMHDGSGKNNKSSSSSIDNRSGDDDKPQSETKDEGTGEKWVKSTGVAADGGDFDAARPGA